jgi:hypothetical protein
MHTPDICDVPIDMFEEICVFLILCDKQKIIPFKTECATQLIIHHPDTITKH